MGFSDWELLWSPYDEATYQAVLDHIEPDDIVLDIGAGDLRLTRRMAGKCRRVYAIEIQEDIIHSDYQKNETPLPENLVTMMGDACIITFPDDVTTGVLLMRHCTHFQYYAEKLKHNSARRLITNARWGFGVEVIPLQRTRLDFRDHSFGWYACWCGAAGFKSGPPDLYTPQLDRLTAEVNNCPDCEISRDP